MFKRNLETATVLPNKNEIQGRINQNATMAVFWFVFVTLATSHH